PPPRAPPPPPRRTPRPPPTDSPVAGEPIVTVRRLDAQEHVVLARGDLDHPVPPADRGRRQVGEPSDQDLLEMVLLKIDEGGTAITAVRQQVEGVDLLGAEERAPHL